MVKDLFDCYQTTRYYRVTVIYDHKYARRTVRFYLIMQN